MGSLPFADVTELLESWEHSPPLSEMVYMMAQAFTTWRRETPYMGKPLTDLADAALAFGQQPLPPDALPDWMKKSMAEHQPDYIPNA